MPFALPFSWRREDSGYLLALLGAATVVVYLVFGNFGLLPAPFSPPDASGILASVEPVLAQPVPTDIEVERVAEPRPVTPPTPRERPVAAPVDKISPKVLVTTEPGAVFGVTEPAKVLGVVEDAGSGISKVLVSFAAGSATPQVVPAAIECEDATRKSCSWSARIPATVADYTVIAQGFDRAGNKVSSEPIGVTVVNPAGPVKQVTDTVARVPAALAKAVTGLLGGLLGALG